MDAETVIALTVVIGTFLLLLSIRLQVGLALLISGGLGILLLLGTEGAISAISSQPFNIAADYTLTIIPLFIVMGVLRSMPALQKQALMQLALCCAASPVARPWHH